MELKNSLYKNIGIHAITTLFTVEKGDVKVLLIKRCNNPFNGYWALPSGALYNNELLVDGAKRELKEKTGLENIEFEMCGVFDKLDRSNLQRMIGISFIGVIDSKKVSLLKNTLKTSNAEYFSINNIPPFLSTGIVTVTFSPRSIGRYSTFSPLINKQLCLSGGGRNSICNNPQEKITAESVIFADLIKHSSRRKI